MLDDRSGPLQKNGGDSIIIFPHKILNEKVKKQVFLCALPSTGTQHFLYHYLQMTGTQTCCKSKKN